jgi:hypothetical protein
MLGAEFSRRMGAKHVDPFQYGASQAS